ncbi:MAG: hypothetical protein KKC30_16605 [Proteobacteria bacterium]|nr:hypothetical protein [Pseudomonadota bacterium]MBU4382000.1 hypothetical protein [Pseudomonadota bacterium]MCG2762876.1 hypothetical protein [Desulfarculaceae bacterium]
MSQEEKLPRQLALVRGILDGAFFSPLRSLDWPAFCFDQPGLLGLEEEEAFDLYVRGALAAETIYPELCEGREPLAWIWSMPEPSPVLAHALASLREDRPFLFHRLLYSLSPVSQGELDPEQFELVEDYLATALGEGAGLRAAAATELATLTRRALQAAGVEGGEPDALLAETAGVVLAQAKAAEVMSDAELLTWLTLGGGLEGVDPEIAPAVAALAWSAWCGAVIGAPPNLALLSRLRPSLVLNPSELALYAPQQAGSGQVISARCPYCQTDNSLVLGDQVSERVRCPHLLYVGTSDEAHLLRAVQGFDLGKDFLALLESYYQSPADFELFATIVDDLYEMLCSQGRLAAAPVRCEGTEGFYYLKAFFAGPPPEQEEESVH